MARVFFAPSRPCVSLSIIIIAALLLPRLRLQGVKEERGKLSLVSRAATGGRQPLLPPRRGPRGAPRQCLVFVAWRLEHLTHILVV